MNTVYIGLGSNLSQPAKQLKRAVQAISTIEHCQIQKISSLYFSRPMGPQDQPNFMNAVLSVKTSLNAIELLSVLQTIENNAGRLRKASRWDARILDLDILLFGQQFINNDRLTIPHYGMKVREFVLLPLHEISPTLILPCGDSLDDLIQGLDQNGLKVFDNSLQL
jgi:2-amino-4-hydroxy-6-hydroxymethyldihydropteridine diphosphokinase